MTSPVAGVERKDNATLVGTVSWNAGVDGSELPPAREPQTHCYDAALKLAVWMSSVNHEAGYLPTSEFLHALQGRAFLRKKTRGRPDCSHEALGKLEAVGHMMRDLCDELRKISPRLLRTAWEYRMSGHYHDEFAARLGLVLLGSLRDRIEALQSCAAVLDKGRSLFVLGGKKPGLGPDRARHGDAVVVICGVRTPLVLRPTTETGTFQVIGAAFVKSPIEQPRERDWTAVQLV